MRLLIGAAIGMIATVYIMELEPSAKNMVGVSLLHITGAIWYSYFRGAITKQEERG